ncbi:hypothetical protein XENOCAPTIV_005603 [Xenoophorus captivus]|uniref:Uncharacterized protein n=1 Tax=Xenoophorus captivus TaxID=1517983 RepID=A0ABV0QZY7_9TELE
MAAHTEPGPTGGFFLLKGSFPLHKFLTPAYTDRSVNLLNRIFKLPYFQPGSPKNSDLMQIGEKLSREGSLMLRSCSLIKVAAGNNKKIHKILASEVLRSTWSWFLMFWAELFSCVLSKKYKVLCCSGRDLLRFPRSSALGV